MKKKTLNEAGIITLFLIIAYAIFYFSFRFQTVFTLNLSPVPNRYITGFIEGLQQEENETTYYNWMVDRSEIRIPIRTYDCGATFEMRARRALSRQGYLYALVNGNRVFMKNIQQNDYEIISFSVPWEYLNGKNFNLQFRIFSDETTHRRGMRVDWVRIIVNTHNSGVIVPAGEQTTEFLFFCSLIILFSFLLPLDLRYKIGISSFAVLLFICANTFYRIEASLLLYHLNRWAFIPSIFAAVLFRMLSKFRPHSAKSKLSIMNPNNFTPMIIIFFAAQTVRILGTFYYQYFYPDLRSYNHYMYMLDSHGIIGFTYWYGHHHLKILYGIATAFPYSPLYHLTIYPLTKLNYDYYVWLRFTSALFNSIFVILIYIFILKFLKDKKAAVFGTVFAAFSSVMFNRLFLCMYSALFSGLITFIAIIFLFFYINKMDDWRIRWFGLLVISLTLLSYPSAVVNFMIFISIFFIFLLNPKIKINNINKDRRFNPDSEFKPLIILVSLAVILAFFIYYVYFMKPIFTELIPFLIAHSDRIAWNQNIEKNFLDYMASRMNFYLSIPGMFLVFPGIWLLIKKPMETYRKKFLSAWFLSWFIIYILSAPQLFSFILRLGKEELFVLPLFACAAGISCSHFWKKGKIFRYLIVIVFLFFIGLSLLKWMANIKSFMVFIE
jgi:hypothetical protein